MRKLNNVRNILGLQKELNFLIYWDKFGYNHHGEGGVITASKGYLVVMKDAMSHNLYKFIGSTTVDDAHVIIKNDELPIWLYA